MKQISLVRASLGARELRAVAEVFRSGHPSGRGPAGEALAAELAARYGAAAVPVANCGAALRLALEASGVQPCDEVIVADYSFPAPAHAVRLLGAVPVFADVRADTGTVDVAAVAELVGPRTVGVVAVDTVGMPADYDELNALTERHGLFLVEDAACAVGATYRGRPAGVLAPIACLSFHGRKGVTSGEGGAVLTSDPALAAEVRLRSAYGMDDVLDRPVAAGLPIPEFTALGHNDKLSDVAAAILRVQLGRLDELLERRRAIAVRYGELLADEELVDAPVVPADRTHSWQSYLVELHPDVDRAHVATHLRAHGIGCGHGTWACHLQPIFASDRRCPVSARLSRSRLAIPMHAELTLDDAEQVVSTLRAAVHARAPLGV